MFRKHYPPDGGFFIISIISTGISSELNQNSAGIQSELSRNSVGTLGAETIANSRKLCS
ncbi:hypothetical protein [Nostoc sp.]